MAKLIKCSDCGKKVSVNAQACPNCGAPVLAQRSNSLGVKKDSTKWGYIFGVFFILMSVSAFATSFFAGVMILIGGVLALPVAQRALIVRNITSTSTPIIVASIVLVIAGTLITINKSQSDREDFIKNNPEAYAAEQAEIAKRDAEKQAQENQKQEARKTSESTLLTLCQINVKNSMKNPSSFDMNYSSKRFSSANNGYTISFSYTGTNSFNATITSVATCNFDNDGRLIGVSST